MHIRRLAVAVGVSLLLGAGVGAQQGPPPGGGAIETHDEPEPVIGLPGGLPPATTTPGGARGR